MRRIVLAISLFGLAMMVQAEEVHYVIKVTPTLVYIDAGQQAGAQKGDVYLLLREHGEHFAQVAEVEIVRVDSAFSIGEITYVKLGETIQVLQRAFSERDWQIMAEQAHAELSEREYQSESEQEKGVFGKRSILFMIGGEWGRSTDLRWNAQNSLLMEARSGNGLGFGVRLGQVLQNRWRLNFTYRTSAVGEVDDLAIEFDMHRLLSEHNRSGLYIGVGMGLHQLSIDAPGTSDDSANKLGFNLTAGLQIPGRWTFVAETGLQRIVKWGPSVDMSHVRTYIGLGRAF
ncbi:MAG: hypothetical protein CME28_02925 [Gemmatimonadetes bacterium]|nr:hypothetical protein [Gemmatimonadota bacterium]